MTKVEEKIAFAPEETPSEAVLSSMEEILEEGIEAVKESGMERHILARLRYVAERNGSKNRKTHVEPNYEDDKLIEIVGHNFIDRNKPEWFNSDLYDAVTMVCASQIRAFAESRARSLNGKYMQKFELDDYISIMYEEIIKKLPVFKASSTNHFPAFVTRNMQKEFHEYKSKQGSAFVATRYSGFIKTAVWEAKAALEAKGRYNPSEADIANYLNAMEIHPYGTKTITPQIVKSALETSYSTTDTETAPIGDMENPETIYMAKEKKSELIHACDKMDYYSRTLWQIMCDMYFEDDRQSMKVPIEHIRKEMKERTGADLSKDKIMSLKFNITKHLNSEGFGNRPAASNRPKKSDLPTFNADFAELEAIEADILMMD